MSTVEDIAVEIDVTRSHIYLPDRIVVFRHAELHESGTALSKTGHDRARYIQDWMPRNFGKPDYIYVPAFYGDTKDISIITGQTVKPLHNQMERDCPMLDAGAFHQNALFRLGHELRYEHRHPGINVYVCWTRAELPAFFKALGLAEGSYPEIWPENDYGSVYVINFQKSQPVVSKFTMMF
ncbi:hypothetical protein [Paraburkholderia sp. BCC1886]|uniref:hypothetical protein n=1 Tax=Paraburkholderia sp. BCC1886 TaxID=2562670 RepID=UPI001182CA6A|nr:hypothetical protein [Paraburkholderia sp. BCC1886]